MSNTLKDKAVDLGRSVAETAKKVGQSVISGAESAADFIQDKTGIGGTSEGKDVGITGIKEHMHVIASCGMKVGVVDHLEDGALKLTKKDSPDGQHHFIPLSWIDRVDSHVHLNKNSKDAKEGWRSDASACGCNS